MSTTKSVSASDISLFHVAAATCGDALQWWQIAQANGLSSPDLTWLPVPLMIVLPDLDTSSTSGLPVEA
nr:hypothetical protein [Ameyamaea chiangmaiensis]